MRTIPFIVMLLFLAGAAGANPMPESHNTPGFLKKEGWVAIPGDVRISAPTAAELKAFTARMMEFQSLLEASPVAGRPIGYNTLLAPRFEEFEVPERPDLKPSQFPLQGLIWFGAFEQEFEEDGRLSRSLGETTLLGFWTNRLPKWGQMPLEWSNQTTDAVLMPREYGENVAGLVHVGDLLILKRNSRPLWVPVSIDESLKLMLAQGKQKLAEIEKKAAEVRRYYTDHIDPAKRAARRKNYEIAAKVQKDPAAFLAQMDEVDRKNGEVLREQAEEASPDGKWTWWADAIRQLKEAEEDYASLSDAQKKMDACYIKPPFFGDPEWRPLSMLRPAGTANCRAVIRPNWNYFDPKLPRSAIQLITIWVRECSEARPPEDGEFAGCPANMALLRSLNWKDVMGIMDR